MDINSSSEVGSINPHTLGWKDLPSEVVNLIVSFCDIEDVSKLSLASRQFVPLFLEKFECSENWKNLVEIKRYLMGVRPYRKINSLDKTRICAKILTMYLTIVAVFIFFCALMLVREDICVTEEICELRLMTHEHTHLFFSFVTTSVFLYFFVKTFPRIASGRDVGERDLLVIQNKNFILEREIEEKIKEEKKIFESRKRYLENDAG